MTRLCGLNPTVNYKPVEWALSRPEMAAEATLTAWEGLDEEDRALLVLLGARVQYIPYLDSWLILFDWHGHDFTITFSTRSGGSMRQEIGRMLDIYNGDSRT